MYDREERVVADLTRNIFTPGQPVTARDVFEEAFRKNRQAAQMSIDNTIRLLDSLKDWILTVIEDTLPEGVMPVAVTPALYSYWSDQAFFQRLASDNMPVVAEFSATDGLLYCVILRCNRKPDGAPDMEHVYAVVMRKDQKTGVQEVKTNQGWEKAD